MVSGNAMSHSLPHLTDAVRSVQFERTGRTRPPAPSPVHLFGDRFKVLQVRQQRVLPTLAQPTQRPHLAIRLGLRRREIAPLLERLDVNTKVSVRHSQDVLKLDEAEYLMLAQYTCD